MIENENHATEPVPVQEVEQAPRYSWHVVNTVAHEAQIFRRRIATAAHAVPLKVWAFCEEHGVDACWFDGFTVRHVEPVEEHLANSPAHAHAKIREHGGLFDIAPIGDTHVVVESHPDFDE